MYIYINSTTHNPQTEVGGYKINDAGVDGDSGDDDDNHKDARMRLERGRGAAPGTPRRGRRGGLSLVTGFPYT